MRESKQEKANLTQQLRDSIGGNTGAFKKLIECMISECHEANESNDSDRFRLTQGEIKGHRKLLGLLTKQKKS